MTLEHKNTGQKSGRKSGGWVKNALRIILPLFVIIAGVAGFSLMGTLKAKPETKTQAPSATPVITAKAEMRSVILGVQSQGEVRPRTEINLAAQISGKITYMSEAFVEAGQFTKGDILIRIESADYDLQVTQSEANVAQAQTVLTREISESDIARRDWEDLGSGEATPLSLREPQLAEARAKLAAAQAGLGMAQLGQERTILRAPFTGRVGEKTVSFAQYITPGQKLGRIYAIDVAEVKLPLTDTDMGKLGLGIGFNASSARPGPEVIFSAVISGEPHTWRGTLTRTASEYDAATRTLFGYAMLNDPYGKGADKDTPLAVGLFVNVEVTGKTTTETIRVPRNALRGSDTIYIANEDNTLSIRTVAVKSTNREYAIISSGISDGEKVIISPVKGVFDGMPIEIALTSTDNAYNTNTKL